MIQLFHWMGAALLPLCGWLTGAALQTGKEQHILQLRHTVELLRRIRQEVLDYYIARFEAFLQQAQQEAAACAGLSCRLGLAAGAVLALIFL